MIILYHSMSDCGNLEFSKMFPLFSLAAVSLVQAGSVFLVGVLPEVIICMKAETPIYQ